MFSRIHSTPWKLHPSLICWYCSLEVEGWPGTSAEAAGLPGEGASYREAREGCKGLCMYYVITYITIYDSFVGEAKYDSW